MHVKNDPEIVQSIPKLPKLLPQIGYIAGFVGMATYPFAFWLDLNSAMLARVGYLSIALAVLIGFAEVVWFFVHYWIKKFTKIRNKNQ